MNKEDEAMGTRETGSQLAIPFARAHRPKVATDGEATDALLATPQDARAENAARIYFCPVCGGRLDARVMGGIRVPYFAHAHGVGQACPWRGSERDGGYGYVAQPRADWERDNLGRIQRRALTLEIRTRQSRALLSARGSPTTLDTLGLGQHEIGGLSVQSVGTRQELRLATIAMQRSEFSVAVADPLTAEVRLLSRDQRAICQWRIELTQKERVESCIAFLMDSDGVGRPVSTLAEIPGDLQLLFKGAPSESGIRATSTLGEVRTAVANASVCIPAVDAPGWYVAQIPWDEIGRGVVRALGGKPLSVRRLLRIMPLSGVSYRGASTIIQPADGKAMARFWVQPNLVDDLSVEIIPVPYGKHPNQSLRLDSSGKILQIELAENDVAGECYVLALDPLDPSRIVGDVRIAALNAETWESEMRSRENDEADGDWTTPLGIAVGNDERPRVLPCTESPACVVTFSDEHNVPGVPSLNTVRLYGPLDFLDRQEFLRTIAVEKNGGSISSPRHLSTARLKHLDELAYTLRLFASDAECTSLTIRFGALGSVQLARYRIAVQASRAASRLRILAALLARPPTGKRIGRNHMQEIILTAAPKEDHGWESEIRQLWRAMRRGKHLGEMAALGLSQIAVRTHIGHDAFDRAATESPLADENAQRGLGELRRIWTEMADNGSGET